MKKSFLFSISTLVLILILLQLDFIVAQTNNEIIESALNKYGLDSRGGGQDIKPRGWMQSAKQMMTGPAGQMVVHFAKELISRSAGNTQILSLNLTNLLILILLKALIFAAGLIGAGSWGQYGRGRSIENAPLIDETETPLFIGFLAAEGSGQDGCLQRAACQAPDTASDYLRAARAVLKGSEIFDPKIQFNPRYNQLVGTLEQATVEGMEGAPCQMLYPCGV